MHKSGSLKGQTQRKINCGDIQIFTPDQGSLIA